MSSSPNSNNLSGLILIDKPAGLTSTTIVRKIKKFLNFSKVGHLGTLDPFATGLLPIMVGGATRLCDDLMDLDKQYLFTIQLGIETDTLDSTGQIVKKEHIPSNLTKDLILESLKDFIGEIQQVPPVYSAIKMNGRPLYEYMRATGEIPNDINTKKRSITIYNIEFIHFNPQIQTIQLRASCSKGTYIRSLARDIALALGTVGLCSELRRERVGIFNVKRAFDFALENTFTPKEIAIELKNSLLSPEQILPNYPSIEFPNIYLTKLQTGNVFFFEKFQDEKSFLKIQKYIETHSKNPKFFAKILNFDNLLFLAEGEILTSDLIKIKPRKKLNG